MTQAVDMYLAVSLRGLSSQLFETISDRADACGDRKRIQSLNKDTTLYFVNKVAGFLCSQTSSSGWSVSIRQVQLLNLGHYTL